MRRGRRPDIHYGSRQLWRRRRKTPHGGSRWRILGPAANYRAASRFDDCLVDILWPDARGVYVLIELEGVALQRALPRGTGGCLTAPLPAQCDGRRLAIQP